MTLTPTAAVNGAVAAARGLPSLIANLSAINPALARQLVAKPLLLAKSPPVVALAAVLTWVSGRYGLGWDDTTTDLVAAVAVLLAGYVMRFLTKQPIAGIVRVPNGVPPEVALPEPVIPRTSLDIPMPAGTVPPPAASAGIPVSAIGDQR